MLKKILLILFLSTVTLFAQKFLQKANGYYVNNEYTNAIKTYYKALDNGENPALIYYNLGNTYYQIDSVAKAIVCYQSCIREAPEFFRGYLNLGILYFNLDDMGGTIAILRQAATLEPDNIQIKLILASAYNNCNEYSLAVPLLESIIEKNPKSDDCYFVLYEIYHKIGDLVQANNWLEKYPDTGKRSKDKYQLLGELSEERGNLPEAVYYYNHLISIAPERKWPYYQTTRIMHSTGNSLSALQQAQFALNKFNKFSELALLAGNIAFETKLYRKAVTFYKIAYSAGNAGGLVGLQNILQLYKSFGDYDNADRVSDIIVSSK